jgi:N-acetylmuramoyl-L-alanine amidase
MARFLLILVLLAELVGPCAAFEWRLAKIEGRDFVPLVNLVDFYGLREYRRVSSGFQMGAGRRELRGHDGSVEFFINGLKFNLSYPVRERDGELWVSRMDLSKVIEPVMRPQAIRNSERITTVVLDAGHGGHDKGASNAYGGEKDYTLDVVLKAKRLFEEAGYRVVLTRATDVFVPLEQRVKIANRCTNALFISVHFNSGGSGSGVETYTLAPCGVPSMMADGPRVSDWERCPGNVRDAENMALATATHAAVIHDIRPLASAMPDRGIKRARFVVIRDVIIPGVLLEGGFLTSQYDARRIAAGDYRRQIAASLLLAVERYNNALKPQLSVVANTPVERRVVSGPSMGGEKPPAQDTGDAPGASRDAGKGGAN